MVQGVTTRAHFRKQFCIMMQQMTYTDGRINVTETS